MREVVLDTETTGLDYKKGDRIIEVGCVELTNHIKTGNNLQFYCSVEKLITESATKIHGLTNEFLKKHKPFEDSVDELLNFLSNDTLIIHNAEFDLGFLNNELKIINKPSIKNEVVDTVALARKKLKTRIANLDYLCKRFDIDLSARKLHGALLDCNLLAEVYLELKGGKQTTLELKSPVNSASNTTTKNDKGKKELAKVFASQKEIQSHKNFVKNIKNALWNKLDY
ncbi:MAG: DNA polymerase III subunit epsilon [Alphaproteobacteria bacterium MarineAlpha5_Bin8]|nr:MAG: DNA polymerase III subunit epsilon [Alphaproteobacteria bacterium MarineAlpha5_Bin7]PPR48356.1 MAG: DNA polymerase III subunit epsilon [Alphaproteobacteria bacterium MarineAlpha5_Bin8]PPR54748.1 MAG: DNA polymerase III subunit epsilon [Alphaproteobacteria bacterium MarineAlpha5_Bin6]|tara:strand:+ start:603 stop:1283 length:681 start_codon:yes stop_codon:yes gene_type:complete